MEKNVVKTRGEQEGDILLNLCLQKKPNSMVMLLCNIGINKMVNIEGQY